MAGSKGDKYYNVFMDYSIWLKTIDNQKIMLEDCFMLLIEIKELGSIKLASEKSKISYRKAWNIIDNSEKMLGFKLVIRQRGGKEGGRTILSDEGSDLVNSYLELRSDINISIKKVTKKFFNRINQKDKVLPYNQMK